MGNNLEYWLQAFLKSKDNMVPENFELIQRHIRRMKKRDQTKANYLLCLTQFGSWCRMPFVALTEDDIYEYSEHLDNIIFEKSGIKKKYSQGTKHVRLSTVRAFLRGINNDAVKSMKLEQCHSRKLPEDLLTKPDIETLINSCRTARDRAIIALMYESGARKGEFLQVKIKNVEFDENGASVLFPDGKTGARRIRVIFASSYLHEWIGVHPTKENRESYLFVSFRVPYPQISLTGLRETIERAAKKAGIQKKVNPHAFRHARATHLAEHLTEQQMKKYLGWTEGSDMAAIYVHLSGKDIDDAILKMNGLMPDKKSSDNSLKTVRCIRCREIQDNNFSYCCKCGMPLNQDALQNLASNERNSEILMKVLDKLLVGREDAAEIKKMIKEIN